MSSAVKDCKINVDLLIKEVKNRPCLYETDHLRYGDAQYKKREWDEVTAALFKGIWNKFDNRKKMALSRRVQARWRSLRTCFTRECRRQRDPTWIYGLSYKRRNYIHYNELLFLKTESDTEEATNDIDLPEIFDTESTNLLDKFGLLNPNSISVPRTNSKVNRTQPASNFNGDTSVNTTASTNAVNAKTSLNSLHSVLINATDKDSTSFALSLVPMLNMLPMDEKVECQIKILSAILPFIKKCEDVKRAEEEEKRKTATPTRQTYGKKIMKDATPVVIKSEGEDDGD